jgi:hypothetical protein
MAMMARMMTNHKFGQSVKLLAAELAIAVLVKPVEQRFQGATTEAFTVGWAGRPIGPLHAATSFRTRPVCGGAFWRSSFSFRRSAPAGLGRGPTGTAATEPLTHRIAHGLPFLVAEPSVAVLVELFDHSLSKFGITEPTSWLARPLRARRLGQRWQRHQARCDERHCWNQVPHDRHSSVTHGRGSPCWLTLACRELD